jgi:hypothetical protein
LQNSQQLKETFGGQGFKMITLLEDCVSGHGLTFCIEKNIVGIGVRNLQALNQCLVLSAAWSLAKEPHSHLALILKAKYHHDTKIWRANSNKPKSAFWTAILNV